MTIASQPVPPVDDSQGLPFVSEVEDSSPAHHWEIPIPDNLPTNTDEAFAKGREAGMDYADEYLRWRTQCDLVPLDLVARILQDMPWDLYRRDMPDTPAIQYIRGSIDGFFARFEAWAQKGWRSR